jgi:hypothetical protein
MMPSITYALTPGQLSRALNPFNEARQTDDNLGLR